MKYLNTFLIFSICLFLCSCSAEKSRIARGHRWFDRGNYDSAIKTYSSALEINPSNPNIYFYRGLAQLKKGELDLSITDFSNAIKIDPAYVSAYINRGSIWKEKGNFDKALADYNMLIKLQPVDYRAYMVRAGLWFKKQKISNALSDYNIAIENEHDLTNAYMGRADVYYFMKKYGEAIRDYEKSISVGSNNQFAYNNLAWLLSTCIEEKYRNGNKALINANHAVKLESSTNNLHTLAVAYAENTMYEKAIKIMEKIIETTDSTDGDFEKHLILFKQNQPLREVFPVQTFYQAH